MDTSPSKEVKPPQHDGTPRPHGREEVLVRDHRELPVGRVLTGEGSALPRRLPTGRVGGKVSGNNHPLRAHVHFYLSRRQESGDPSHLAVAFHELVPGPGHGVVGLGSYFEEFGI